MDGLFLWRMSKKREEKDKMNDTGSIKDPIFGIVVTIILFVVSFLKCNSSHECMEAMANENGSIGLFFLLFVGAFFGFTTVFNFKYNHKIDRKEN